MLNILQPYFSPIIGAIVTFPFAAFFITLPFAVRNYRKYGGISALRVLIVYSFVLYMLCAFLLTVLPLPSRAAVAAMPHLSFNWIPFRNLARGMSDYGMILTSPGTWTVHALLRYMKSSQFFQIIANIAMLVPLGIYLRYYFRCRFGKTVLFGFLTSLFFEMVQLSGLFFIYSQPYRCPDVNDLMANTFGCAIGFIITPLFTFFLPTRDELDNMIIKRGEKITIMRQFFAAVLDWIIISAGICVIETVWNYTVKNTLNITIHLKWDLLVIFLYFCVLQWLLKGYTPGKRFLRIRCVKAEPFGRSDNPSIVSYIIRYAVIYILYPLLLSFNMLALGGLTVLVFYDFDALLRYSGLALGGGFIFLSLMYVVLTLRKHHLLPHDAYSHIKVVLAKPIDSIFQP